MKKLWMLLPLAAVWLAGFAAVWLLVAGWALAEDPEVSLLETADDDLLIEEYWDEEAAWNFPVVLEDMNPRYVILANKQMHIDKEFVAGNLVTMKTLKTKKDGTTNGGVRKASGGEMKLAEVTAQALVEMFTAAEEDGIKLYLKSAYRSYRTQKTMYYNRLKANKGKDDGWVTPPGTSDHQTGLGCDIVSYSWKDKSMNSKFAATPEAQWMAAHCQEYGFVIRYPEDKVEITEINYEPWHLRYVGIPAATYIMENGLCLEEFHEELVAACEAFIADGGDPARVEGFMQVSVENE